MAPPILHPVEADRLAAALERLCCAPEIGALAAPLYAWLWLRCAAEGTPGLVRATAAELGERFRWGGPFVAERFGTLERLGTLVRADEVLFLPEYLRVPADPEQGRAWGHYIWELHRQSHRELALAIDQKLRGYMMGARVIRRAYEQGLNA